MAFLLGCEKVRVEFPTKTVFTELSLGVDEGARIGIVGKNGDGKSTLLRVLAGEVEVDDGRVIRTRGVSVGVLGQTDGLRDEDTVERAVVGDVPEYEWAGDARTRSIIAGLLGDVAWDGLVGTLSGGQRRRGEGRPGALCPGDSLVPALPGGHHCRISAHAGREECQRAGPDRSGFP